MCASQARSSLSWGDSIDVARMAMESYKVLLCQRWLITESELDQIYNLNLLPSTDEELIVGYHLSNPRVRLMLIRMMDDETKKMVVDNEINALDALRVFRIKKEGKAPPVYEVKSDTNTYGIKRQFRKINQSRKLKGRKQVAFVRTAEFSKRMAVKKNFMDALNLIQAPPDDEEKRIIDSFIKPPDIVITYCIPRARDLMPTTQGGTSELYKRYNIKGILAKRLYGLTVTNFLTDEEEQITKLDDDSFDQFLQREDTKARYEGFKFKSPGGLPLMRMHNDTIFVRPVSFRFHLSLSQNVESHRLFTHNGIAYPNIQPVFWGMYTLKKCQDRKMIPAFAYSFDGDLLSVFYKKTLGRIQVLSADSTGSKEYTLNHKGHVIYCPVAKDASPIDPGKLGIEYPTVTSNDITGDSIAMLNYGNYMNTQSSTSMKLMNLIFRLIGADIPAQGHQLKPKYPYYIEGSIEFSRSKVNHIIGTKFITFLKLTDEFHPDHYSDFDVSVNPPRRTGADTASIQAQWV